MVHDSKQYRQPSEHEAAQMKAQLTRIDEAMRRGNASAEQSARMRLQTILKGMGLPKGTSP
jgi:hypothetical protein